ncbi:MAG: hypothetical protein CMC08_06945 [Flavobacteriaceae bacterium]|nr:hypothetical protein [Flavobacteriaceae bacterium]
MEKNRNDEIDLFFVYNKVKQGYKNFLVSIYRWSAYFLRNWIALSVVIISGILIGYWMESKAESEKQTTLIVQLNFDSVNYVYNAVAQLKKKINEQDKQALFELETYYDDIFKIKEIEIEPVPNILDIIEETDPNNRNIEILLDQSKYEEDLLLSEMFIPEYKIHKISIVTAGNASMRSIEAMLSYLNNNITFNEIKEITIENTQMEVQASQQNINAIDSILKVYGTELSTTSNSNQIYLNTANNGNIHLLTQEKISLVNEIQKLKTELVKYDDGIVSVLNKPMLEKKGSLLDRKAIIMPIVFVFFFVLITLFIAFVRRVRTLSETAR